MSANVIRGTAFLAMFGVVIALVPSLLRNNFFSLHPAAMVTAYCGLMAEGVLLATLVRHEEGKERLEGLQQHGFVQFTSLVAMALGFLVIYKNKVVMGKSHFTTLHGKLGLVTVLLSALSALMGVSGFRAYGIVTRFSLQNQLRIKAAHRKIATVTWYLSLLTMQLAMPHPAVLTGFAARIWQALVLFLGFAMFVLLMRQGKGKLLPARTYGSAHKLC